MHIILNDLVNNTAKYDYQSVVVIHVRAPVAGWLKPGYNKIKAVGFTK